MAGLGRWSGRVLTLAGVSLAVSACGDDEGGRDSDSGSSGGATVAASTGPGSDSGVSAGQTTTSVSGSDSEASAGSTTTGATAVMTSAATETTSTAGETTGDASTTAVESESDTDSDSDSGDPCAGMGGGQLDFSYIWVANSAQGTVSKINTLNMFEEGRYIVRPDSAGNPSRTSVNLRGDVAIANRFGGITKIFARVDDCIDLNGNNTIDSSTGKFDIRAWGQEECVAWYADFPQESRRVA